MKRSTMICILILAVAIPLIVVIAITTKESAITKEYILTPSEYTITRVDSYHVKYGRRYQVDITYEKEGKVYKSHNYLFKEDEYNIIKNYFDNGNEEAAKNYIGDILVHGSLDFEVLKEK